ncbi:MAG: hypothetical protein E7616_04415 [Ruminococcaceae bacterium]|nr:hypothetical protein [Oscillospiraceae bacterium]
MNKNQVKKKSVSSDPFRDSLNKQQKRKYFILKHWRKILFIGGVTASLLYPVKLTTAIFTAILFFNIACLIGKWVYTLDLSLMTKFKAEVSVMSLENVVAAVPAESDPAASASPKAPADNTDLTKALEALSKLYNKQITEKDLNEENKTENVKEKGE